MAPSRRRGSGKTRPPTSNPFGPTTPRRQRAHTASTTSIVPTTPTSIQSSSFSPSVATDSPNRSSTRSGRAYLPEDTGIYSERGRRRVSANTRDSDTVTPSRRSSAIATPIPPTSPSPQASTATQPAQTDASSSAAALPARLPHLSYRSCFPEEYRRSDPPTSHDPVDIAPSSTAIGSSSRPSVSIDRFIRMSHYERYEHAHQPQGDRVPTNDFTRQNLFGVPPDHDEWVKRIFGDQNSTSPEHEPAKVSIPNASMGSGGGSFADMYGQIMNDRAKGDSPSSTPSAIITAPLAFENIPPRSSSVLDETNPFTAMPPSLTPVTRAYHRMASRFVREYAVEGPQPPCTEADCPLSHIRHLQGTYLDNNTPALNPLYHLFGTSNPPANVWQAIHAGTQEEGTQEDTDLIARFIKYHVTGVRFSVVPHGNFIWGEEGGMNEGVAEGGQRPWVRLPFPALPLRVVFDAEVNFLDKV